MRLLRILAVSLLLFVALINAGCAVVSVVTTAVGVGVTTGSLAVDVVGGVAKGVVGVGGAIID
jgi:hypothetical protein